MLDEKKKKQQQQACSGDGGGGAPQKGDNGSATGDSDLSKDSQVDSDQDAKTQPDKPKELIEDTGGFGGILPPIDQKGNILAQDKIDEIERNFEMTVMNSARILEKSLESSIGDMPGFVQEIIKAHTKPQTARAEVKVKLDRTTCDICSRISSGYYEAILQVRGEEKLPPRALPEIRDKLENQALRASEQNRAYRSYLVAQRPCSESPAGIAL